MAVLQEERLTCTVESAARRIGVSKNHMSKFLDEHPRLSVRVGRRRLVSLRRLQEFIDQEEAAE